MSHNEFNAIIDYTSFSSISLSYRLWFMMLRFSHLLHIWQWYLLVIGCSHKMQKITVISLTFVLHYWQFMPTNSPLWDTHWQADIWFFEMNNKIESKNLMHKEGKFIQMVIVLQNAVRSSRLFWFYTHPPTATHASKHRQRLFQSMYNNLVLKWPCIIYLQNHTKHPHTSTLSLLCHSHSLTIPTPWPFPLLDLSHSLTIPTSLPSPTPLPFPLPYHPLLTYHSHVPTIPYSSTIPTSLPSPTPWPFPLLDHSHSLTIPTSLPSPTPLPFPLPYHPLLLYHSHFPTIPYSSTIPDLKCLIFSSHNNINYQCFSTSQQLCQSQWKVDEQEIAIISIISWWDYCHRWFAIHTDLLATKLEMNV